MNDGGECIDFEELWRDGMSFGGWTPFYRLPLPESRQFRAQYYSFQSR